uniref:DUF2970 domain-containing protein n=1 Tax=Thaumasiovibrio occultus TaxID=1891184 RepID=UPI000B360306|nr:DUF2970 domain-containing protein [Thaumasiovibrio occultus]
MTRHNHRPRNTLEVLLSVLSALFGVQSDENRYADFKQKSPLPYIVIGVVLIAFFVLGLVLLVKGITGT